MKLYTRELSVPALPRSEILKKHRLTNVTIGSINISSSTGSGASTFLQLTDTPVNYAGNSGKVVSVNTAENALIFSDSAGGVTEHNLLTGRDDADAHPISSITDLQTELDEKVNVVGDTMTGSLTIETGTSTPGEFVQIQVLNSGNYEGNQVVESVDDTEGKLSFKLLKDGTLVNELELRENSLLVGNEVVWHEGNFNPDDKVSKSGDTMTGDLTLESATLILEHSGIDMGSWHSPDAIVFHPQTDGGLNNQMKIGFFKGATREEDYLYMNSHDENDSWEGAYFEFYRHSGTLKNHPDTGLTYNGSTIWNEGNDGKDSGLDADMMWGKQPVQEYTGAVDVDAPIRLNEDGYVDATLLETKLLNFIAGFQPTAGDCTTEYPAVDEAVNQAGDWWMMLEPEDWDDTNPGELWYLNYSCGSLYQPDDPNPTPPPTDIPRGIVKNGDAIIYTGHFLNDDGFGNRVPIFVKYRMKLTPGLYYWRDGSHPITANFEAGNHKLVNVADGADAKDGVNKSQLDTKVSKAGDTMTGTLDFNGTDLTISHQDIATASKQVLYCNPNAIYLGNPDQPKVMLQGHALVRDGNNTDFDIWHEGNFNPGDKVSKAGDTMTGNLTVSDGSEYRYTKIIRGDTSATVSASGDYAQFGAGNEADGTAKIIRINRLNIDDFNLYDTGTSTSKTIWHEGNAPHADVPKTDQGVGTVLRGDGTYGEPALSLVPKIFWHGVVTTNSGDTGFDVQKLAGYGDGIFVTSDDARGEFRLTHSLGHVLYAATVNVNVPGVDDAHTATRISNDYIDVVFRNTKEDSVAGLINAYITIMTWA